MQTGASKPAKVNRPTATDLMLSGGKVASSYQAILQFRLREKWRLQDFVAMR